MTIDEVKQLAKGAVEHVQDVLGKTGDVSELTALRIFSEEIGSMAAGWDMRIGELEREEEDLAAE